MVSTRNHPKAFPEPTASPTKRSVTPTLSSLDAPIKSPTLSRPSQPLEAAQVWSHTPSNLTLIWLAISLPLVIWDSGYVFGRPYTMPGGKWVWPLYTPYELYGTIDYIYGAKAWDAHNGFTAAQGSLNILETIMYFTYLYIVYQYGQQENVEGRGAPSKDSIGKLGAARTVYGRQAGIAVLIAFSAALMTLSKTVLYCAQPWVRRDSLRKRLTCLRAQRSFQWIREHRSQRSCFPVLHVDCSQVRY